MWTSFLFVSTLGACVLSVDAAAQRKGILTDRHLQEKQASDTSTVVFTPTSLEDQLTTCVKSTTWVTTTVSLSSESDGTVSTILTSSIESPWVTSPLPSSTTSLPVNSSEPVWSVWSGTSPTSSEDSTTPTITTTTMYTTTTTTIEVAPSGDTSISSNIQSSSQVTQTTSMVSRTATEQRGTPPTSSFSTPLNSETTIATAVSIPSSSASPAQVCSRPSEPYNYTSALGNWYGLNVVNTKPAPGNTNAGFKTPDDWDIDFTYIKNLLPHINAIRMYSTMDPTTAPNGSWATVPHLDNALLSAHKHGLKILVGVWSGDWDRFGQERAALNATLQNHGCDDIVAVSVGNEDLNTIDHQPLPVEVHTAMKINATEMLVEQMKQTRDVLDGYGCCHIPVTHTDTWNEFYNSNGTTDPWAEKLIKACDSFAIVNMFPYWQNARLDQAYDYMTDQAAKSLDVASRYGKDLWLGETGWPRQDQGQEPNSPASVANHQAYFNQVGCQVLSGNGSAFYYVDWDEDKLNPATPIPQQQPLFGIMSWDGKALIDTTCSSFKPDSEIKSEWPSFMGGQGAAARGL